MVHIFTAHVRRWLASGLTVAGLLSSISAHASGRLPPLPIEPRSFPDFAACRAFLDETYRQDLAKADPRPVPIENGTRQTLIESKGPINQDASHASYEVTEGWQILHPEPEKGHVEISYSFRTTMMTCDGGALTGTEEQGYNLPSKEDLPAPSP